MSLQHPIAAQTNVFLTLAHRVASTKAFDKNFVFSPLSLHVVLSLIAAGASGSTRDELLVFLRLESCDELNRLALKIASNILEDGGPAGGPMLKFANGVWVDHRFPLNNTFKQVVDWFYKAAIDDQVDFLYNAIEVLDKMNSWAENQTNGLIKDVVSSKSINNRTRLILANALYFKGEWADKFDASKTKHDDFHLLDGGSIKVPFMTSYKKQFVRTFKDFKVLRLPYEQGLDIYRQFSMYVFLPNESHGLPTLLEKLCSKPGYLEKRLPTCEVQMREFMLPKFKISFGFEANDVLNQLGVKKPFIPGGLTDMVDSPKGDELYVSRILQKSVIEVNEEGTEAPFNIATCCSYPSAACRRIPVVFVADHPFIFVIRDDMSGVILLIGHVMDPSG